MAAVGCWPGRRGGLEMEPEPGVDGGTVKRRGIPGKD
jgi:hypothetical protein